MSIIIFLITTLALNMYLYGIGLRYIGILHILLILGVFFYFFSNKNTNPNQDNIIQKNSLLIARVVILGGLFGTLFTLGVDVISNRWIMIILNFVLRVISYFVEYEDGKKIFQYGLYITIFSFLGHSAIKADGITSFLKICLNISLLTTIMIGAMPLIISLKNKKEESIYYKLFLSGIVTIFFIILNLAKNTDIAIVINLGILTVILYQIYLRGQKKSIMAESIKEDISIRRILAGERISQQKGKTKKISNQKINSLVQNIPEFNKIGIEFLNIFLLIIFIRQYISTISKGEIYTTQILYRINIILIIGNIILLKKIKHTSIIQNLILFIIINFSIYFSLFSIFQSDFGYITIYGIIRNIASSLFMFYAHKINFLAKTIKKIDYSYRIVCLILGMVTNLVLLIKTNIAGELIFFLFILYLGIQSMILYYVIKFISKLEIKKEEPVLI